MVEELSVARLRARRALRTGRIIAFLQSVLIFLLLVSMSEEYDHNQLFQAWAAAHLGGLSFLLNGTLAAFYAGLVITYYLSTPIEKRDHLIRKKEDVLAEVQASRAPP